MNSLLIRYSLLSLVLAGGVSLALLGLPLAVEDVRAAQKDQGAFGLVEIRLNREYNLIGLSLKDKLLPKPGSEVLKLTSPSGKVELEMFAERESYTHKMLLTVFAPATVADGQIVPLKATVLSEWVFKDKVPFEGVGDLGYVAAKFHLLKIDAKPFSGTKDNPIRLGKNGRAVESAARVEVTPGGGTFSAGGDPNERAFSVRADSGMLGNQLIIDATFAYRRGVVPPTTSEKTKPPDPKPPDPKPPDSKPPAPGCPPDLNGTWHGPVSGPWTYQTVGHKVTGTITNLGGKYGRATVSGTASGKIMKGTWQSAMAKGSITVTGPDEKCITWMDYTVDTPPGPAGQESGGLAGGGPDGGIVGGGHGGKPWETPQGQACFEEWIALATKLLNAYNGTPDFNARKPWGFNKYGLKVGKGIESVAAPDNFPQYGNNKYWWMWDYWITDAQGRWNDPMMNGARVPPLRDYVSRCAPSTGEPPLGDGMILLAPDLVVPKGTVVLTPIQLINPRNVLNLDAQLEYLPEVVAARNEAEKGSVISEIWEFKLNRPGLFKFNFAQLTPVNNRGTVVGFRFDAIGPGRSRTPLKLAVHTVNDAKGNKLPITTINGSITIYDPSDLSDPNNPNNPDPPGGTNNPPLQPTCSGTGRQTVADAQCCLKMWVGLTPRSLHMDINRDGEVDSRDAVLVLQNVARGLSQ